MEEKKVTVTIGGEVVDITDYPPITVGDKKKLKKELGISLKDLGTMDEEQEAKVLLYLLQRVRKGTTEAEVDALSTRVAQSLFLYALDRSAKVEVPFSMPSTSSATPTVGDSVKS